jgi:hypothetical protein
MKIVAIKPAFFDGRRVRVGDELDIPQGSSGSWFTPVASIEAKATKVKPAKSEPRALSQLHRDDAKSFNDVHENSIA